MPLKFMVTGLAMLTLAATAGSDTVVEVDADDVYAIERILQSTVQKTTTDRGDRALLRLTDTQLARLSKTRFAYSENPDETAALGRLPASKGSGTIPGYACYRTVEQTYADLAALALAYPDLASWEDIGDSWEKINGPGPGHDVMVLKLSSSNGLGEKAPLVIIAAIHARELVTAETATRFAEHLVNQYGVDADVTWLLDHRTIYIVPQLNPDGREDVEDGTIWHRKNADVDWCPGGNYGVDLNRNSSYQFGGSGSSGFSCDYTYRGPSAASEPEVSTIETAMSLWFEDQRGAGMAMAPDDTEGVFISLHSFGELVLFPWEYSTATNAPNLQGLRTLSRKFGFHNDYEACQDCLGSAAGTTVDQAYGEYGVAAYTFELGTSFHQACSTFENTIYPDNLPALLYAAKAARRPYMEPKGPDAYDLAIDIPPGGTVATLTAVVDDTRYDSNGWGTEPTQPVSSVVYSIDDPTWLAVGTPMLAVDGQFDSTVEAAEAEIDLSSLSLGRHLVFVAATDADGNTGPPTAIFLDVDDLIFDQNFE